MPATYVTTPGGWGQDHGCWDRALIEGGSALMIQFQNGPAQTRGTNGVELIEVLKVCVDYARALQRAEPSRDRACVITKLDEALLWERKRLEEEHTREQAVERAAGRIA
jgi:hypothetical protein